MNRLVDYLFSMARKSTDWRRIETRRAEIAQRLSSLETEFEKLRAEDFELATAEAVLKRLSGIAESQAILDDDNDNENEVAETSNGDLTIGDMAMVVLREAGEPGLTSNEVLEAVRKRWLPTLMRTSLSPPLSRLKTKGEIVLVDDRWRVATAKE